MRACSSRAVASSDSFVAIINKAGGVWFDGGRQWHLVKDYGGTRTQEKYCVEPGTYFVRELAICKMSILVGG